jgi:hypothetical protein
MTLSAVPMNHEHQDITVTDETDRSVVEIGLCSKLKANTYVWKR